MRIQRDRLLVPLSAEHKDQGGSLLHWESLASTPGPKKTLTCAAQISTFFSLHTPDNPAAAKSSRVRMPDNTLTLDKEQDNHTRLTLRSEGPRATISRESAAFQARFRQPTWHFTGGWLFKPQGGFCLGWPDRLEQRFGVVLLQHWYRESIASGRVGNQTYGLGGLGGSKGLALLPQQVEAQRRSSRGCWGRGLWAAQFSVCCELVYVQ